MTAGDRFRPQRLLGVLLAVGSIAACSSTTTTDRDTRAAVDVGGEAVATPAADHRSWETDTRRATDELRDDAGRLAEAGRIDDALGVLDDALCEVLAVPPGYRPEPPYLDYLAGLLDQITAFEDRLVATAGEEDGELVELPMIEIADQDGSRHAAGPVPLLPASDYPIEFNPTVMGFLDALTQPGEYRTRVETGLGRSGRYLPMIRDRLRAASLPEDLAYLPLIESAFSVKAYSRARAHGMWQFISSTGRHYGLEIGTLIDDRRDPVRSTDAAIAYLRDLHDEFSDWHLALAAYNSGAGNVRRAVRRAGSRDFWVIRRHLPRETRNYVPAFIASVIVAKQPDRFGFPEPVEQPWQFDEVVVPDALDLEFLAERTSLSLDTLRELNPAIRRDLTPARRDTPLRLPTGSSVEVLEKLSSVPRGEWAPRLIHTVGPGDSLYVIARRYGSSVSAIRQANGINGSLIRPGQSLLVPRFGLGDEVAPPRRTAEGGTYVVQRADTLWGIARSFDVSVTGLCAANNLSRWQTIRPGQRLRIPGSDEPVSGQDAAIDSSVYRVRPGDTLYGIARRFGTSVSALQRANGIHGSKIYPGDRLRIPVLPAAG